MQLPQPMIESQISRFASIGSNFRDHTDSKANNGYKALQDAKGNSPRTEELSQVTALKAHVKVYMAD
jgi:hypothetical protein